MERDSTKSKHAHCLNALDEMQQSFVYAARHMILREAEGLIVAQEQQIDTLQAALDAERHRGNQFEQRCEELSEIHCDLHEKNKALQAQLAQRDEQITVLSQKQELLFRYQCPKAPPSCLMCGQVEDFAIKHLDLGAIGICKRCVDLRDLVAALIDTIDAVDIEHIPADVWKAAYNLKDATPQATALDAERAKVIDLQNALRETKSQRDKWWQAAQDRSIKISDIEAQLAQREEELRGYDGVDDMLIKQEVELKDLRDQLAQRDEQVANLETRLSNEITAHVEGTMRVIQEAKDLRDLVAALRHLVHEVDGCIEAFPVSLRDAIGTTNLNCLKRRSDEAKQLLATPQGTREGTT